MAVQAELSHAVADVIEHHVGRPVTDELVEKLAEVLQRFLADNELAAAAPRMPA